MEGIDKEQFRLLVNLHTRNARQGPGSYEATLRALELSGIDTHAPLKIADIGCGTGAASILLAKHTKAHITAVDFLPEFLEKLQKDAEEAGVLDRMTTLAADMADLPFELEQFDVIWAEGAIYNIGFEKGLKEWRRFLKPDGVLAVSEITWLTEERPAEVEDHWKGEYPEIDTAANKILALERSGYTLIDHFVLPPSCWLENYYDPIEAGFDAFLARHDSVAAREIVAAEEKEIALYKTYKEHYSYGFYIARKQEGK